MDKVSVRREWMSFAQISFVDALLGKGECSIDTRHQEIIRDLLVIAGIGSSVMGNDGHFEEYETPKIEKVMVKAYPLSIIDPGLQAIFLGLCEKAKVSSNKFGIKSDGQLEKWRMPHNVAMPPSQLLNITEETSGLARQFMDEVDRLVRLSVLKQE